MRHIWLTMGLYMRALYNELILYPCFIYYDLVFLRFSVMILCYGMGLYRGLALFSIMGGLSSSLFLEYILLIAAGLVSIGFESYVLKVLSRFYNAIDSGTGKPGAGTARPGGHTPGGGQRPGTGAAGSGVSSRKTEKETKRIFYYLISIDYNRFKCYTNPTKTTEVHYGIKQYRT